MECNMQSIEKALQQQTPHGSAIYNQMAIFREMQPQQTAKYHCMCTFVAFGTTTERTLLLSCLMYALQPELLYSAYVKTYESKEYETILLLKKKISVDFLEQFLELFRFFARCDIKPHAVRNRGELGSAGECPGVRRTSAAGAAKRLGDGVQLVF
jgi:hypothetical protein